MNRVLALSTLLSVLAISFSALNDKHNRYGGAPYNRNSLNYQGGNRYSAPRSPGVPHSPNLPHSPRLPQSPRLPHSPRGPGPQSYGSQRRVGYGGHQSVPGPYGGGARHFNPSGSSLNQYQGPVPYAGPTSYAGPVHASAGGSHFSSAKRSVYQPQQDQAYGSNLRSGYSHPQNYAQTQQHAQSTSQSHGREMKYTIRDPQNRGTTHVTETHVVSNKQMHGAEAEAAMKKLMGSMGPGTDGGFNDFVKGMGIPFY